LIRRAAASATLFLAIFSTLHMVSDAVGAGLKLPFLASSEAVWEHLKMGVWAALITYSIVAACVRRWRAAAAAAYGIAATFTMFTYYYAVVCVTGLPSRISLAADLAIALAVTWLSGFSASVAAQGVESGVSAGASALLLTCYLLLIWLTIATTYVGVPIPLFSLPPGA